MRYTYLRTSTTIALIKICIQYSTQYMRQYELYGSNNLYYIYYYYREENIMYNKFILENLTKT